MKILQWWRNLIIKMNDKGIAVPMIRDPQSNQASVSLTLVFISFNLVVVSVIGKYSKMLEGVDTGQALQLFYACAALYWGRKFQSDGKGKIDLGDKSDKPE